MAYSEDDILEIPTIGSVKAGDTVMVALRNGEPTAIGVVGEGDEQNAIIAESIDLSATARAIAEATGQHFWSDDNGAHVTELEQEEYRENPRGAHILMNSLGILFERDGKRLAFYGSTATQIGESDDAHVLLTPRLMQLVDANGEPFFSAGDLRQEDEAYVYIEQEFSIDDESEYVLDNAPDDASLVTATQDGQSIQVVVSGSTVSFPTVTDGTVVVRYPLLTTAPYYFLVNGNVNTERNVTADGYVKSNNYTATVKDGSAAVNYLRRTDVNARVGQVPGVDRYLNQIIMRDSNNERTGYMMNTLFASGTLQQSIGVSRQSANGKTRINNGLGLRIDKDGNRSVYVSEQRPWIEALGIGDLHTAFSGKSLAVGGSATSAFDITDYRLYVVQVTNGCQLCLGVRTANSQRIDFFGMEDNGTNAYRCHGRLEFSGTNNKTVTVVGSTYGNITGTSRAANNVIALYGLI